jgi:hypothetical protein
MKSSSNRGSSSSARQRDNNNNNNYSNNNSSNNNSSNSSSEVDSLPPATMDDIEHYLDMLYTVSGILSYSTHHYQY